MMICKHPRRAASLLGAGVLALALGACGEPASFSEAVEAAVSEGLPGVAMYVRVGDQVWTGAAGHADLTAGTRVQADDRFLLVGATQPFLAVLALQLAEEGSLNLDATLTQVVGLERLYNKVPDAQRITVRHVLEQQSGLSNHFALLGYQQDLFGPAAGPDRVLDSDMPLAFANQRGYRAAHEPGGGASFSATNATLLGIVLETAADSSLAGLLQQRIFAPVGMDAGLAGYAGPGPDVQGYAYLPGTFIDLGPSVASAEARNNLYGTAGIHPSWAWASGGIACSAADLGRFADALFRGDLISEARRAQLLSEFGPEVILADGTMAEFGLGVMRRETAAGPAIGHDGGALGHSALVYYVPELDLTVAAVANSSGHEVTLMSLFHRVVGLVQAGRTSELSPTAGS